MYVAIRNYIVLTIGFTLCFVGITSAFRQSKSRPTIATGPKIYKHDFGEIRGGTRPEHTFAIRNVLNKSIRPISTTASCRCVTVMLEEKEYRPGEHINIKIALETKDTSNLMNHNIHVKFDDGLADCILKIEANCKGPLEANCDSLTFTAANKLPAAQEMLVSATKYRKESLLGFKVGADWIKLAIDECKHPKDLSEPLEKFWECMVSIDPKGLRTGIHRSSIVFKLSDSDATLAIPITVHVQSPVSCFPKNWYFFNASKDPQTFESLVVLNGSKNDNVLIIAHI